MTSIEQAVNLLKSGKLVAFPTETVYGLGADAANSEAIKKIFLVKGRPINHPVIVHICDISQLNVWAKDIPPIAYTLASHFWPGPMTVILPAADAVSSLITGGQESIGLRMPAHPIARELLLAFGGGIAAPSANRFGRISPTHAEHVKKELGEKVSLILEGGECQLGLESTIIDLTSKFPRILRPGPLTLTEIEAVLSIPIKQNNQTNVPRVSGNLASHYAPRTPIKLIPFSEIPHLINYYQRIAVMAFEKNKVDHEIIIWKIMPDDSQQYAKQLYATLRELDEANVELILIETPPQTVDWLAVNDRLKRASG